MKKINLPNNPFKSGVFILMLGFFVNALAIFMLLTQLMPRSVSAQTTSPTYYQEYWCAGEVYAGVNPSGYASVSSGDNAIWQRFKRDCRWRAVHTYSPYGVLYQQLSGFGSDYQYVPGAAVTFDEFRTVTMSGANPLYNILFNSDGTPKFPWDVYLRIVAPQPFSYSYKQPVWSYMRGNEFPRSLNFSDQSAGGSESNSGFVTEWYVYGRIGVGPMLKDAEAGYGQFGSFENLVPTPKH